MGTFSQALLYLTPLTLRTYVEAYPMSILNNGEIEANINNIDTPLSLCYWFICAYALLQNAY